MTGGVLVLIALGLLVACVIGIRKAPKSKSGMVVKVVLGLLSGLILLWLVWLAIMVFGVGPAMKE